VQKTLEVHTPLDTVHPQNPPLDTVRSKEPKYGTPEGCITGILENSEQLQAIIKKDWEKLEQLNKKQHDEYHLPWTTKARLCQGVA
jgi:hypothetical protein